MKRLTKLQKEYLDENTTKDSFIAYPSDIFQSQEYKEWKRKRKSTQGEEQ